MAGRDLVGRRGLVAAVVALALAVVPTACGDDDEDEGGTEEAVSAEEAEEVIVVAQEYTFDASETPTADTKTVTLENHGAEPHELIFARINEGYTVDEAYELEGGKGSAELLAQTGAKAGETSVAKVRGSIEPGHYAMLCPIQTKDGDPHYKLGQLIEFDIE
jgi:hypothetical protein